MDEQDRYYKKRNEQLSREENQRQQEDNIQQFQSIATYGIYFAVFLSLILFFLSPGILIQVLVIKALNLSVENIIFWVNAFVASIIVGAALTIRFGFHLRAALWYGGFCIVSLLLGFYIRWDGYNIINIVANNYMLLPISSQKNLNNQQPDGAPKLNELVEQKPDLSKAPVEVLESKSLVEVEKEPPVAKDENAAEESPVEEKDSSDKKNDESGSEGDLPSSERKNINDKNKSDSN